MILLIGHAAHHRAPATVFLCCFSFTGTVSMPFYTVYVLMGYWDLGPLLCDLWLSVDYTVCLVSQYTVLLITIDRFCSVKIAAKYRSWRTKDKVIWMVTITWIVPALLFFISIFGWEHFVGYRDLLPGQCAVQFLKDPVFNTALIIGYYWTTLVVLFVLYGGIYKTAYEMQKKSEAKQRKMQSMVALSSAMTGMAGRTAGIQINKDELSSQNTPIPLPTISFGPTKQAGQAQLGAPEVPRKPSIKPNDKEEEEKSSDSSKKKEEGERSSSPAFDSDEESSAPEKVKAPKKEPESSSVSALIKKRTSIAGLLVSKLDSLSLPFFRPSLLLFIPKSHPSISIVSLFSSSLFVSTSTLFFLSLSFSLFSILQFFSSFSFPCPSISLLFFLSFLP